MKTITILAASVMFFAMLGCVGSVETGIIGLSVGIVSSLAFFALFCVFCLLCCKK